MSPALPKKERRYRKKRSRENQEEVPPEIPVKGTRELLVSHSHQPFSIFWALISSLVSSHMLATSKHRSKLRVSLPWSSWCRVASGMFLFLFLFFLHRQKKTLVIFSAGFNARCVAAGHKSLYLLHD